MSEPISDGRKTIVGMDELLAKLQALKKTEAKKALRKGTRAGAKIVAKAAKQNAPHHTGKLEKQVKVRSLTRSRRWTGVNVQLEIFYGAFQELGFKHTGGKEVAAKHFLLKAATDTREQALSEAMQVIKGEIEKI